MKKIQQPEKRFWTRTKRGDTIVEVMFAIAIFSLVAVLSISSMNLGVARAQNALELTTVRNEINAQAEAIRFIYNEALNGGEEKAAYRNVWNHILQQAEDVTADDVTKLRNINSCSDAYKDGNKLLTNVKAFVIDARLIGSSVDADLNETILKASGVATENRFIDPPINARIVYRSSTHRTDEQLSYDGPSYTEIASVEGMWDYIVKGTISGGAGGTTEKTYYDFYINACWYGAGAVAPTKLDTVIRLYKQD